MAAECPQTIQDKIQTLIRNGKGTSAREGSDLKKDAPNDAHDENDFKAFDPSLDVIGQRCTWVQ